MSDSHAEQLVRLVVKVMECRAPVAGSVGPRASAILTRQALESAMEELWKSRRIALETCSKRVQLLCLRQYLADKKLAEGAAHAW